MVFLKSFFCVSGLKRRHEVKGQDDQIKQPLLTEGEGDNKIGVRMTEEETSINTPENEKTHDDYTKDEFDSQSEEVHIHTCTRTVIIFITIKNHLNPPTIIKLPPITILYCITVH